MRQKLHVCSRFIQLLLFFFHNLNVCGLGALKKTHFHCPASFNFQLPGNEAIWALEVLNSAGQMDGN